MKLIGYCVLCRRIKRVTVNMTRWTAPGGSGAVTGICDDCERKEREKRHDR